MLATSGLSFSAPAVAQAGYAGQCTGANPGVTEVVQFGDGSTTVRCAPGNPSSGLDALTKAGFSYTFAQGQPGFVCTIDGQPSDGSCMKPNYWAYFHGSGGSWSYSSTGAGSYDPACGSSEGWRFGGGSAPTTGSAPKVSCGGSAPKPAPKPSPRPAPTHSAAPRPQPSRAPSKARPSTRPAGHGTGSSVAAAGSSARAHRPGHAPTRAAAQGRHRSARHLATAPRTASDARAASPTASATPLAASGASSAPPPSGGSSSGWLWGLLVLLVLGGATGAVAVVRRRG